MKRRGPIIRAAVIVAAVVLAGCSDDHATTAPAPPTTAAPIDAATSTPTEPKPSTAPPTTVQPAPEPTPDTGPPTTAQPELTPTTEPPPRTTEQPQEDEQPEQVEPGPGPEGVARGSQAPEWPFRGLVEVEYDWADDSDGGSFTIRYLSSMDRTVTEVVVEGLEPLTCGYATIDGVSETGVTVPALQESADGPTGVVMLFVPWGRTARTVPWDQLSEGASAQELLTSVYDLAHGYVVGGTAFDVSIHANGVRLNAGQAAENYQYETWGSPYPDVADSPPPERVQLHGDRLATWDSAYFLGTDGEFVGFASYPYEPGCAPATGYLLSMRTGEAFVCGFGAGGIALVQPPQDGLLVEKIALPSNRQLREECDRGTLAERWASLPPAPTPYPPKQPAPAPPLPTTIAPAWPFQGAVMALQRYVPHLFSYETVLQYRSSEDGSITEFVFGPMRSRSRDLVVSADEHAVEVWRGDWAVRVPWGSTAEPVDIELAPTRPARTTAYPTHIVFGQHSAEVGIESFIAENRSSPLQPLLRFSRLSAGPYWSWGQQSWYVWSAPDQDLINVPLDVIRKQRRPSLWLRGTDGHVAALSREGPGDCRYLCDPVLTVLISLETGQVLSCGVELDGADALVFVAPEGTSMASPVELPPSGWLDLVPCYSYETGNAIDCSWLWPDADESHRCGRLFELAASPNGTPSSVVPAWIQADLEQQELLILPAAGE